MSSTKMILLGILVAIIGLEVFCPCGGHGVGDLAVVPGQILDEDAADESVEVDLTEPGSPENSDFVPTSEWQAIKPGSSVPRGLHYRLNLETGKREAKKLSTTSQDKLAGMYGDSAGKEPKYFSDKELKLALKDLKDKKPSDLPQPQENEIQATKQKFRSYDELKRDFEAINVGVKTDVELIRELISDYNKEECPRDRKLLILKDLEYLVHQIDNANNFVDMNGLELVRTALNDTDTEFRLLAAYLLGSASQSNPKVQVEVVRFGLLHQLIQNFPREQSPSVRKKALFAFSTVLRHFPFAQKKFLELGGTDIFRQVLSEKGQERQKVKIVTLLSDLIMERKMAESSTGSELELLRLRQYQEVGLVETLVAKNWCDAIPGLLALPDWDSQEKVLEAMRLLAAECRREFSHSKQMLASLEAQYVDALKEEHDNDYLHGLLATVRTIKDEL